MTTSILLIRHAQTDWNVVRRWQGHKDVPLNRNGRYQSKKLAQRLADWPIDTIYTSDLQRAYDTAASVGKALNIEPIVDPALRERNGGQFQGLTIDELRSKHSEFWTQVRQEGKAPPGGESNLEVARRIVTAYASYLTYHENKLFAIVSHGGALQLLISYVLGFPLGQLAAISLSGNTGISLIRIDGGRARLALLNDTVHIDGSAPAKYLPPHTPRIE